MAKSDFDGGTHRSSADPPGYRAEAKVIAIDAAPSRPSNSRPSGRKQRFGILAVAAATTVFVLATAEFVYNGSVGQSRYVKGVITERSDGSSVRSDGEISNDDESIAIDRSGGSEAASSSDEPSKRIDDTTTAAATTSGSSSDSDDERNNSTMAFAKEQQIRNYREGSALMVNFHPTHHGGTVFCNRIGHNGIHGAVAPGFACMGDKDGVVPVPPELCDPGVDPFCYPYSDMNGNRQRPWRKDQTGPFVDRIRPYFHMISWEFKTAGHYAKGRALDDTDWEHPRLLSVLIARDPISRLLAGDGIINRRYEGFADDALGRKGWWDYAVYDDRAETDNVVLRLLLSRTKPNRGRDQKAVQNHVALGVDRTTEEVLELFPPQIDEADFERAKTMLNRFTVVLDIACLDDGIDALGALLGLDLPPKGTAALLKHTHAGNRERIGHDDVYEYLLEKNRWDIALYEYSKSISLVRC